MTAPIQHRGPDDFGVWAKDSAGVALGFRRLAIIDLSKFGHQPMKSASGRFVMVFNGEVYNHRSIRAELVAHGARFQGHSDTEVMLAAFETWGIEHSLTRFVGMFAIAVWDEQRRELTLARDRLGKKPLFIYAEPGFISFGSEIKALQAAPRFDRTLDLQGLTAYLRYLYVPAPRTIFANTIKLLPGHSLTISDPAASLPDCVSYWSLEAVAQAGVSDPFLGSESEAVDQLQALLTDAVQSRMEADVPLGALLSGGIDSSTIVALMQRASDRPVKTFTIGFDVEDHDESKHAAAIAGFLGTDHTALHLSGQDALEVVPRLPEMFDEPLADPSQIPTYLVSRLARESVTVALSGDGGDELFAGYNRYVHGERLIEKAAYWPKPIRRLASTGLTRLGPAAWDRLHGIVAPVLPGSANPRLPGVKMVKMGNLLAAESEGERYRSLMSAWQDPRMLMTEDSRPIELEARGVDADWLPNLLRKMMFADQLSYLPDDLLAKVDRASMAVSLEARVPLLDHRVVEFSWRLPRHYLIRDGGKWILRQVLYRLVRRDLVDRPKVGFTVPIETWLRGPLREWAEDHLAAGRRAEPAILNWKKLQKEWRRFVAGDGSSSSGLWAVVNFAAWQHRWC